MTINRTVSMTASVNVGDEFKQNTEVHSCSFLNSNNRAKKDRIFNGAQMTVLGTGKDAERGLFVDVAGDYGYIAAALSQFAFSGVVTSKHAGDSVTVRVYTSRKGVEIYHFAEFAPHTRTLGLAPKHLR